MPWTSMPEVAQQERIDRLRIAVEDQLKGAVRDFAGGEAFPHFAVKIESLTVKDGSKLSLTFAQDSHGIEDIVAHVGRGAVLVLAPDPESYLEGLELVKAEPDQHPLLPDDDNAGLPDAGAAPQVGDDLEGDEDESRQGGDGL